MFSGSIVSLAGVASLELEVAAATAEDLDDDDFFLRFFSMPAFLAPLSLRPPPADVYSDDGMAGGKEGAMGGGRWGLWQAAASRRLQRRKVRHSNDFLRWSLQIKCMNGGC